MLYQLLRFPLVLLFLVFYRRVLIAKKEHFPKTGGVILATNHTTAFSEQMLLAASQWRGVYFWVRATALAGGFLGWIFKQVHLIPINRREEGLAGLAKNKETFEISTNLLLQQKVIYISPEGNSEPEKRLREFKTGTARVALQTAAASNFEAELYLLPAGVNYTAPYQFRSEVFISYAPPIRLNLYKEAYLHNPRQAVQQLNADLFEAIRNEMVYINDKEDDVLVEQLLTLFRNNKATAISPFPAFYANNGRLEMEKEIANTVNQLEKNEKDNLKKEIQDYFNTLIINQLNDTAMSASYREWGLKIALLAPFALVGSIMGFVPVQGARYLRQRLVKDKHYWAPLTVALSALTWLLYCIVVTIIGILIMGWWGLCLAPMSAILQHTAFTFKELYSLTISNWIYRRWKNKHPKLNESLIIQRTTLVNKVSLLIQKSTNI